MSSKWTSGGLSTSRIEAFSDGVFAIAITLLVLGIQVPEIPEALVAKELPHKLLEMWPKFFSYALSFVITGLYWVAHHNIFHNIKRSDRFLLWLNILFLMCVSFIPFPSAILGEYGGQQIAVVLYGATLIVTGLVLYSIWWYATSGRRLVNSDIDPRLVNMVKRKILIPPLIYLLSIGISFFSVQLSILLYILVPVLYILPGRIDRHWNHLHGQKSE